MVSFNKTAHLRRNIDAIKAAFTLERENRRADPVEKVILQQYSGFGAIKEVIDPLPGKGGKQTLLTPLIEELQTVLRENTAGEREYKRFFDGIKDSVLTAYYTPFQIADALSSALVAGGITPRRMLDPSAGSGVFADSMKRVSPYTEITCFEKDPMTGLILKHLNPGYNVRVQGYETIEPKYNGYYDAAISNIPFGDVALFDPAFSTHRDPARRQATRTLHNYFFTKSADTVREGGIIAFITSQGVMNSPQNRPIRELLMNGCDLVSAIRLPNNLFTGTSGTEVGSDLIVLQRKSGKEALSPREQEFLESVPYHKNINTNKLFIDNTRRIVATEEKLDTDPYGKPALIYTYSGGMDGIAGELGRMLREDISRHLDLRYYLLQSPDKSEQLRGRDVSAREIEPENPSPQLQGEESVQASLSPDEREAVAKAEAEGYRLDVETGELTPFVPTEQSTQSPDIEKMSYRPTPEDWADYGIYAAEKDRRSMEEHLPVPKDYGITETVEVAGNKVTIEQESSHRSETGNGFRDTLFDMDSPGILSTPVAKVEESRLNVQQEPLITLYDLFGFSPEERSQVKRPRRRKKSPKTKVPEEDRVIEWREEIMIQARDREEKRRQQAEEGPGQSLSDESRPIYPVEDTRKVQHEEALKRIQKERWEQDEREEYLKPIPFKAGLLPHYREGSLVSDENNRIGYLKNIDALQPMFHPLDISQAQERKASLYVEIRDTYYHLYRNEADRLEANPALREMLNRLYDDFTGRYGKLNDKKNVGLIKMDARGTEILSLERYIDGVAQKADIFHHPVAFNADEVSRVADAHEALVASLNKYAGVNLEYMASLTGGTRDEILTELRGRIYYNPDIDNYEVSDKYIAGNVIEKAEAVERFLKDNPGHPAAEDSLRALREAAPKPIAFDDLDFNFGERWIPKGIYERYASQLFDTDVSIQYSPNIDEFSIKADKANGNVKIMNQYAVDSQSRKFNGIHLMKHALHNTSPDITKKVTKVIDGELKEVKVRDSESIQLANSKIDEIRNGFPDWLCDQSPEFKDRLANLYNRTFNCYVRPNYDGSHQTFPGLDLRGLGIPGLYQSQKDAVWMDKLLGGGICDHEVGGGKTLIMCCGAMEKKRLGLANKPMITGLKANIHEIARTFCTAYPNARVLYPGKEDFTPKKREQLFREIKNNDWDAVILTHEQFGKIPQSPELQKEILQSELDSVEENLEIYKAQGNHVSRAMLKGCIRRKLNLEAKLQTVMHTLENRKDDAVDFKLMGIDHIYVDESHYQNFYKFPIKLLNYLVIIYFAP